MVEYIQEKLVQSGFIGVRTEYDSLHLYMRAHDNVCRFVDVVDYRNPNESGINTDVLIDLNRKLTQGFTKSGYGSIEVLTIIVTYSEVLAEQLAGNSMPYWVMDTYNDEFIIPAAQPVSFDGVELLMRGVLDDMASLADVRQHFSSGLRLNNERPPFKLFTVNNLMVLINVVVYLVLESMGSTQDSMFMIGHGAFYWPAVYYNGEIYRFFTSMFIHFGFSHLFSNMVILFCLGDNLERAVGKLKYIVVYIISGLGASVVSCVFYVITNENIVAGGASGAIFGVVGALIYIVTVNHGKLEDLDSYRLIIFAAFSLYSGFTSTGVDNAAHVGGFLVGLLMGKLLYKKGGNTHEG